jgi:hypothetical protein
MECHSVDAPSVSRNQEVLMWWCVFQASHIGSNPFPDISTARGCTPLAPDLDLTGSGFVSSDDVTNWICQRAKGCRMTRMDFDN